jgi:hypothetical protein
MLCILPYDSFGLVFSLPLGANTRQEISSTALFAARVSLGIGSGMYNMSTIAKFNSKDELLDWNGNPIPEVRRHTSKNNGFKTYRDKSGKEYWINESGEQDYELPYLEVSRRTESGTFETLYDSRCSPPLPVKVLAQSSP